MRKLSVYRAHVTAAQSRIAVIEAKMQQLYASSAPFSVSEARLANALAGDHARQLVRAEADLARMMPGFESARAAAIREYGRVRVLEEIRLSARVLAGDGQGSGKGPS